MVMDMLDRHPLLTVLVFVYCVFGLVHCVIWGMDGKYELITDKRKRLLIHLLQGPFACVAILFYAFVELLMMIWDDYLGNQYENFKKYLFDGKEED